MTVNFGIAIRVLYLSGFQIPNNFHIHILLVAVCIKVWNCTHSQHYQFSFLRYKYIVENFNMHVSNFIFSQKKLQQTARRQKLVLE